MIIVLKPHTSEENIHRVENLVKKHGLDTHLVQGTGMTIIGCCLLYTSDAADE